MEEQENNKDVEKDLKIKKAYIKSKKDLKPNKQMNKFWMTEIRESLKIKQEKT